MQRARDLLAHQVDKLVARRQRRRAHLLLEAGQPPVQGVELVGDPAEEGADLLLVEALPGLGEGLLLDPFGCEGLVRRVARAGLRRLVVRHRRNCRGSLSTQHCGTCAAGGTPVSSPPNVFSSLRASSSVRIPTTFMLSARPRASLTSAVGTRNSLAPAFRAVIAFCSAPPIGPTAPSGWMVPVTATFLPPVKSPGVSSSRILSVNARPADGPLTRPVSMLTSTGKSNFSLRVPVEIPIWARPWHGPSGVARLVMVTSELAPSRWTVNVTGSPAEWWRTIGPRSSESVTASPSTAVMTSPTRSLPSAGARFCTVVTTAPCPLTGTVYPRRSSATRFAVVCESAISSLLRRSSWARDRPWSTSSSETTSVSSSSQPDSSANTVGRSLETDTVRNRS